MKRSNTRIVAKLGKLCRYLDKLESHPGTNGCTTVIRKARMLARQIGSELSAADCNSVTADEVFTVGKCLVDVLILMDKLKNYFISYQQFFYGPEYSS
jgi:hypothetical protein